MLNQRRRTLHWSNPKIYKPAGGQAASQERERWRTDWGSRHEMGWRAAEVKKVNEAQSVLVLACVVARGRSLADQRGLFFNQERQTAPKSCITSVTSEQRAIKGFTDSYETDLPAEGFVTHGFCSFLPFGTLGGAAGSAESTLDWGHSPSPRNCNKLVFLRLPLGWLSGSEAATLGRNTIRRKDRPCLQFATFIISFLNWIRMSSRSYYEFEV